MKISHDLIIYLLHTGQDIAGACGQLALVNPGNLSNVKAIDDDGNKKNTSDKNIIKDIEDFGTLSKKSISKSFDKPNNHHFESKNFLGKFISFLVRKDNISFKLFILNLMIPIGIAVSSKSDLFYDLKRLLKK